MQKSIDHSSDTITFTLPKEGALKFDASSVDKSLIPVDGISFYIMRLSKVIVVQPQGDFFIGRYSEEDLWNPQVNLADLDGFANGVSRRHAMIRPLKHGYEITDLQSTNGTTLNDYRLVPNKAYPLAPGAQLSIGKENIIVIYRLAGAWSLRS